MSLGTRADVSNVDLRSALLELKGDLTKHSEGLFARLSDKIDSFVDRITKLEQANEILAGNIDYNDKYRRKNNICIYGFEPDSNIDQLVLLKQIQEFFRDKLGIIVNDHEVNNVYLLGRERKTIKVEFVSYLKKVQVLNNSKKLKGTEVYISHDLSLEQRRDRKILNEHLKLARQRKYYAYIKGNVLVVNGDRYTAEKLKGGFVFKEHIKSNSAPPTPQRSSTAEPEDNTEPENTVPLYVNNQGENHEGSGGGEETEGVISHEQSNLDCRTQSYCNRKVLRSNSANKKKGAAREGTTVPNDKILRNNAADKREGSPGVHISTRSDHFSNGKIKGG